MSPAVHGGGPRWKFFEYNTLLSVEPFREERIMDANRYFTAMHNAMSSRLPGAQLLAAVRLQDLCGNDAYLEVRRMPGEHCATVCYSTMGRRGLNFQLFRKGWMLCHNESGQLTGQFPAKAESLLEDTDFHACCREDRLDAARTDRMVQELETLAGTDCDLPLPRDARTGAVITVDSFVGRGAHWSYSSPEQGPLPAGGCHPVLAGRQPGRSRAPHPAGRPGGRPTGRTVAERHGGDVLPPGRTGCRPAADAAPDPAGEPSGTSGPHLRPHQKLAEHSGRHGEHVKRLPLAGEPF